MSAELKKVLNEHPKFIVDFEEEQIMIYREYTIEPEEYSEALELGQKILSHLPKILPVNETVVSDDDKKKVVEGDVSVFVSKTEL